jgi:hypothetical protein
MLKAPNILIIIEIGPSAAERIYYLVAGLITLWLHKYCSEEHVYTTNHKIKEHVSHICEIHSW